MLFHYKRRNGICPGFISFPGEMKTIICELSAKFTFIIAQSGSEIYIGGSRLFRYFFYFQIELGDCLFFTNKPFIAFEIVINRHDGLYVKMRFGGFLYVFDCDSP